MTDDVEAAWVLAFERTRDASRRLPAADSVQHGEFCAVSTPHCSTALVFCKRAIPPIPHNTHTLTRFFNSHHEQPLG